MFLRILIYYIFTLSLSFSIEVILSPPFLSTLSSILLSNPSTNIDIYLSSSIYKIPESYEQFQNYQFSINNVSISPLQCKSVEKCDYKTTLMLNKDNFNFLIVNSFTLNNIIIKANDIVFNKICENSNIPCCDDIMLNTVFSDSNNCGLLNRQMKRDVKKTRFPFFSFKDIGKPLNLTIKNTEIYFLNAISYTNGLFTFILIDIESVYIILDNLIMEYCYFEDGIISSTVNRRLRKNSGILTLFINDFIVSNYNFYNFYEKILNFLGSIEDNYIFIILRSNLIINKSEFFGIKRLIYSENSEIILKNIVISEINLVYFTFDISFFTNTQITIENININNISSNCNFFVFGMNNIIKINLFSLKNSNMNKSSIIYIQQSNLVEINNFSIEKVRLKYSESCIIYSFSSNTLLFNNFSINKNIYGRGTALYNSRNNSLILKNSQFLSNSEGNSIVSFTKNWAKLVNITVYGENAYTSSFLITYTDNICFIEELKAYYSSFWRFIWINEANSLNIKGFNLEKTSFESECISLTINNNSFYLSNGLLQSLIGSLFSINNTNNLTILDSTFAQIKGNSLFSSENRNNLTVLNCNFRYISPINSASVITLFQNGYLIISNATFSFISSINNMILLSNKNKLIIERCFFWQIGSQSNKNTEPETNEDSDIKETIIKAEKFNELTITQCDFQNNWGSLLYLTTDNNLIINKSFFFKSKSRINGGLLVAINLNMIEIHETVCIEGESIIGGFLYIENLNDLILNKSIFKFGRADRQAGFIYLNKKNNMRVNNSEFSGGFSMEESGFLYTYIENTVLFDSSIFKNLFASLRGGAFYLYYSNALVIKNCRFSNNTAGLQGGTLYVSIANKIIFQNILIENYIVNQEMTFFIVNFNLFFFYDLEIKGNIHGIYIAHYNNGTINKLTYINQDLINKMKKTFLYIEGANITLGTIKFLNHKNRGFLYAIKSNVIIQKLFLIENEIISYLNVALLQIDSCNITIVKGIFRKNKANLIQLNGSISIFNVYQVYLEINYFFIYAYQSNCNLKKGFISTNPLTIEAIESYLVISSTNFIGIKSFRNKKLDESSISIVDSYLNIKFCLFLLNRRGINGSALSFKSEIKTSLNLNKIIFIGNSALKSGGAVSIMSENKCDVYIKSTIFKMNTVGEMGGSLFLVNISNLSLINVSFISNRGIKDYSQGGSLYIVSSNNNLKFENIIINKSQSWSGGCIYIDGTDEIKANSFRKLEGCKAIGYGPIIASPLINLGFVTSYKTIENSLYMQNLISGYNYHNCQFYIGGTDRFNQLVISNENLYQSLIISTQIILLPSLNSSFLCGNQKLIKFPARSSRFKYKFGLNTEFLNQSLLINLNLAFRDCIIGELKNLDYTCTECPINSYTLNTLATSCIPCLSKDPFICYGGAKLTPKPGYWRSSYLSDNFMTCPNPMSCLGYEFSSKENYRFEFSNGKCLKGYKGVLCSECEENYGHSDRFKCSLCDFDWALCFVLLGLIAKIVIILFSVHKSLIMCLSLITSDIINLRKVVSNILMKILFNHLQCLIIVFSIPSLLMPDSINKILSFTKTSSPNMTDLLSLECALKSLNFSIKPQYVKLIIIWISPLILVLISFAYLTFYIKKKKKKYVISNLKDRILIWYSIGLTVLMILYPDCFRVCLENLNCMLFDSNISRLTNDFSIQCWNTTHYQVIYGGILPYIGVLLIGFPLFVLFKLTIYYKKNGLIEKQQLLKYGYFYFGYDKQFFYWDFIILTRKISIILIDIFFLNNLKRLNTPVLIIFLILFISFWGQLSLQPYRKDKLSLINSLENKSLMALIGTVYAGLVNIEGVLGDKNIIIVIVVIFLNINFALFWFLAFYKYIMQDYLRKKRISIYKCFISIYGLIKKLFFRTGASDKTQERWALFDKYTIELKKRARKTPIQENLIEKIRRTTNKINKRKTTMTVNQPDRFRCKNCEMSMKIEEENRRLKDEIWKNQLESSSLENSSQIEPSNNLDDEKNSKTNMIDLAASVRFTHERSVIIKELELDLICCLHQKSLITNRPLYNVYLSLFLYGNNADFYIDYLVTYEYSQEIEGLIIQYNPNHPHIVKKEKKDSRIIEHSLLINLKVNDLVTHAIIYTNSYNQSPDFTIEIPYNLNFLFKFTFIDYSKALNQWNNDPLTILQSSEYSVDIVRAQKTIENNDFFSLFSSNPIDSFIDYHVVCSICDIESTFLVKIILKRYIHTLKIMVACLDKNQIKIMDFIIFNIYNKLNF